MDLYIDILTGACPVIMFLIWRITRTETIRACEAANRQRAAQFSGKLETMQSLVILNTFTDPY